MKNKDKKEKVTKDNKKEKKIINKPNDTVEQTSTGELGQNRFNDVKEKNSLKVRLISTIFLLLLLFMYVSSGFVYTYVHPNGMSNKFEMIDIAAYFGMFCSMVLILGSIIEINRAFKLSKWYLNFILIASLYFLFLFPTSLELNNFAPYTYLNLAKWFKNYFQFILILFIFLEYIIIWAIKKKDITFFDALFAFSISILIIYGYKGFMIISFQMDNAPSPKPVFSANTIIWVWMMVIFADSFAYLGGMRFGKTQLAPKISPKKTWEGALIGISSAILIGILYSLLMFYVLPGYAPLTETMSSIRSQKGDVMLVITYIALSILFPVIGLVGDLLFSLIKRHKNIKDFSNFVPGHGGILDRMDSITTAFAGLYLLSLLTII